MRRRSWTPRWSTARARRRHGRSQRARTSVHRRSAGRGSPPARRAARGGAGHRPRRCGRARRRRGSLQRGRGSERGGGGRPSGGRGDERGRPAGPSRASATSTSTSPSVRRPTSRTTASVRPTRPPPRVSARRAGSCASCCRWWTTSSGHLARRPRRRPTWPRAWRSSTRSWSRCLSDTGSSSSTRRGAVRPHLHEALSTRHEDGAAPGVVLDVVEKGYRSAGSVLRPARVVVSG